MHMENIRLKNIACIIRMYYMLEGSSLISDVVVVAAGVIVVDVVG